MISDDAMFAISVLLCLIVPSAIATVLGYLTARRNGEDLWS